MKFSHAFVAFQEAISTRDGVLCNRNVSRIVESMNSETELMHDVSKRFVTLLYALYITVLLRIDGKYQRRSLIRKRCSMKRE